MTILGLDVENTKYPSISIVIPYYETGELFLRCMFFLNNAIIKYKGKVEVIIVDDGSVNKPLKEYLKYNQSWLKIVILAKNQGRTCARNIGLNNAQNEIVFFIDSDILVDDMLLVNHSMLHVATKKINRPAICVSFFEFTNENDKRILYKNLSKSDIKLNDFRIECTYDETWIGCNADRKYVDQYIKILEDTNYFKNWSGQYMAWVLPNMVLGGAFSVIRSEILAVDGFDTRFKGYGFTETSAVTKLITQRNNTVIPCIVGGALHVENKKISIPKYKKDKIFREKHNFYFNTYLNEEAK